MSDLFSVPAFFVMMRESVEACVVLSVMLRFLSKVGRPELRRHVWAGAAAGLSIALIFGVAFIVAFYVAAKHVFTGKTEQIFTGSLTLFACIVITVLAVGMLKIAKFQEAWERKLAARLMKAEGLGSGLGGSTLFWIPLTCILREGLECVIFLAGVSGGYPAKSIPIPGIIGLLAGFGVGWMLYKAGNRAGVQLFLGAATALLLFISAGLLARATNEYQLAGMLGYYEGGESIAVVQKSGDGDEVASGGHAGHAYLLIAGVWNTPVWNICDCCGNSARGWELFRAILGYQCAPSPAEIFAYLLYWLLTITYMAFKLRWCCFNRFGSDITDTTVAELKVLDNEPVNSVFAKGDTNTDFKKTAQIA